MTTIFGFDLLQTWFLKEKTSSRELLVCKELENDNQDSGWTVGPILKCLDHFIADNGGIRQDWELVKPKTCDVFSKN